MADGRTAYERRFGEPFKGPITPFGAMVEYFPMSAKDQSRLHHCGENVVPGVFFGDALVAGRNLGKEMFWLQTLVSWDN